MSDQETLIFQTKLYQQPQINLAQTTSGRMWIVNGCAFLAILQSSLSDGLYSLFLALFLGLSSVIFEAGFCLLARNNIKESFLAIKDGSALASALVFTLLLPNRMHPLPAFFGVFLAIIVIKQSFGGLGANWLNPALGAYLVIRFAWPAVFAQALAATAPPESSVGLLLPVLQGVPALFDSWDIRSTTALNKTIFALTRSELPTGYLGLLFYTGPGIIADRGLLALLLGSMVLVALEISRFWMTAVFLGIYAFLLWLFGTIGADSGNGDLLQGLLSGTLLCAGFLMLTEPSTGAKSSIGAGILAGIAGIAAFIFTYKGMESQGALYAIALVNCITPVIRGWESRFLYQISPRRRGSA